jgi:hypothetical protein
MRAGYCCDSVWKRDRGLMNYFAHALPFLDRPYFAAATGIPDWLTVVDRKVRLRSKHVEPFLEDDDPQTAAVAGGVLQHIRDDAHFHGSRAFVETTMELSVRFRDALGDTVGFRPAFLGHLLVEVLLDDTLIVENPGRMEKYFALLAAIDLAAVEAAVNRMAPQKTERLAPMISGFRDARILSDYHEDAKLVGRVNQVMRRVKLPPVADHFVEFLPAARCLVADRMDGLLDGIPTSS